jgi:site-specific recombinase
VSSERAINAYRFLHKSLVNRIADVVGQAATAVDVYTAVTQADHCGLSGVGVLVAADVVHATAIAHDLIMITTTPQSAFNLR